MNGLDMGSDLLVDVVFLLFIFDLFLIIMMGGIVFLFLKFCNEFCLFCWSWLFGFDGD